MRTSSQALDEVSSNDGRGSADRHPVRRRKPKGASPTAKRARALASLRMLVSDHGLVLTPSQRQRIADAVEAGASEREIADLMPEPGSLPQRRWRRAVTVGYLIMMALSTLAAIYLLSR